MPRILNRIEDILAASIGLGGLLVHLFFAK